MYSRSQIESLIARITLPGEFRIEITEWQRVVEGRHPGRPQCALQVQKWRKDVDDGRMGWGEGGRYLLEETITPSGVVLRVFKALLAYDEHERRESGLLLDGKPVLGPHPVLTDTWELR